MSKNIDISGLDRAEVLTALFNNSRQQGMGFLDGRGRNQMTADDAREILKTETHFDYLRGRVMKISIDSDTIDPWLYDRDNGQGAAEQAINSIRAKQAA